MRKLFFQYILCLIFLTGSLILRSQNSISFLQYEDSIHSLLTKIADTPDDSTRIEINNKVINLFNEVLTNNNSFNYAFEKIKNISNLRTDDGLVRLLNWNLPLQNGEFIYFCFIQQMNNKKKEIKLYQLKDQSLSIENPNFATCSEKNWYGALYYKILTKKHQNTTYYTLLGWDGNNNYTNKKLIDNFYFEDEKLVFGKAIFKMEKNTQNRLIFEYAEQAKMMLRYDEKLDLIVWDHLAPSQPNFVGQFMYYGPDLSQDGLKFTDGYWMLKPNIDIRNMQKSTGKSIKKSF
jgi:hypothetical protein